MHNIEIFILLIFAYLMGSIPIGILLDKYVYHINLTAIGSGNIGATNAFRGNKKMGILTFVGDAIKGAIVVGIGVWANVYWPIGFALYIMAFLAVIGHMYPVWLKFKGGKGISTTIGVVCVLNLWVGLLLIVIWGVLFALTHTSWMSSLGSTALTTLIAIFIANHDMFMLMIILCVFIFIRHKNNILEWYYNHNL